MPAALILPLFFTAAEIAAGGLLVAASAFAIRVVATLVISKIMSNRTGMSSEGSGTAQVGNRVQLPPATDNKIPVVYGSAYMKPIVIDAKISTDQQYMWYVTVFSEAMDNDGIGTFTFNNFYWGDKLLTFDDADKTKVVSWTASDGTTSTQCAGLINIYAYRDGSMVPASSGPGSTSTYAYDVLADTMIDPTYRWDSNKKMSKLVFAIVKIKYDQKAGLTGLAEVTCDLTNSLDKPGDVIYDYLQNTRYGANLPDSSIDTASLTELNSYSDGLIYYTPSGGGDKVSAPRYRINGPVDTTKNLYNNILEMVDSCDSWLQFNESRGVAGQWGVIVNRSYKDLDPTGANIRQITSSDIIGGVDVTPVDLNSIYNIVEVAFPNKQQRDQATYYSSYLSDFPNIHPSPNEPVNKLSFSVPYTNNIVEAQYIASRRLLQNREDLIINFTMDYSGIQIDAGDVIGLNFDKYQWGSYNPNGSEPKGKLFRVTQVQEALAGDGTLFAKIVAAQYNDQVYNDDSIALQDFTPDLNTGITDPNIISTPDTPGFDETLYTITATVPATGALTAMEFWIGTDYPLETNTYKWFDTEYPSNGSIYDAGTSVNSRPIISISSGTIYLRVRGVGTRNYSGFSDAYTILWGGLSGLVNGGTALNSDNVFINPVSPLQTYYTTFTDGIADYFPNRADPTATYDTGVDPLSVSNLTIPGSVTLKTSLYNPVTYSTGTLAVADGTSWDPAGNGSGPYLTFYDGTVWKKVI